MSSAPVFVVWNGSFSEKVAGRVGERVNNTALIGSLNAVEGTGEIFGFTVLIFPRVDGGLEMDAVWAFWLL
jgi:hypothetical protein